MIMSILKATFLRRAACTSFAIHAWELSKESKEMNRHMSQKKVSEALHILRRRSFEQHTLRVFVIAKN